MLRSKPFARIKSGRVESLPTRHRAAGFNGWKNDLGLSIVFDRPPEWIVRKWSLSTVGDYAYIFTMGHVNRTMLDKLVKDLEQVKQVGLNEGLVMTVV